MANNCGCGSSQNVINSCGCGSNSYGNSFFIILILFILLAIIFGAFVGW